MLDVKFVTEHGTHTHGTHTDSLRYYLGWIKQTQQHSPKCLVISLLTFVISIGEKPSGKNLSNKGCLKVIHYHALLKVWWDLVLETQNKIWKVFYCNHSFSVTYIKTTLIVRSEIQIF